ncbi:unnamed protein product, partial [Amoebophrya sp. A120]
QEFHSAAHVPLAPVQPGCVGPLAEGTPGLRDRVAGSADHSGRRSIEQLRRHRGGAVRPAHRRHHGGGHGLHSARARASGQR